jgi:hypothetical protein
MSAKKTGIIITPARKTLRFRTPLREKTSNTTTTTTTTEEDEEEDDETEALLRHELARARAEIALLREEKAMRKKTSGTSTSSKPSFGKKKKNEENELKSPVLLPSPPTLETPMRFRRERDSFRKELKMLSQNAEENETKMLEENEKTMRLSRENEAWLLKALNEKTRALKIAAKANNASEKELAQTKENASLLEKDVAEHAEKVRVLKLRLVKNERARKKLETKVERYREALKDANLRHNNNGGNEEAAMMSQESVDTAMSHESYCGENKVALRDDDDENNIIHNNNNTNNNTRVKVEEEKEKDEDEEEVHFRVFPEQMVDTNDPLLGGVPATPAMFQFAKMHKNVVGNNEYETRATDMTTTPGGGEVVEFYGRPRRDTRKDVFVILSVWMMTIAALVSMGKSSSLSSQVVAGHRVVVKGFGFFC